MSAQPLVVTGASGFLGRHLVRRLAGEWPGEIVAISRRSHSGSLPGVRVVGADLRDAASLETAIPIASTVVHLAYDSQAGRNGNLAMATTLAQVCVRARVDRLVHVSTAAVVGLSREPWVTEATIPRPVTDYQRTKLAVEEALARETDGRLMLVILRPTSVFGGGGANLRKLIRDLRTAPWPSNYARLCLSGRRAMNLVPIETVTSAVGFVLGHAASTDGTFFVSDDEASSNNFRDVEGLFRRALGVRDYPLPPVLLPIGCLTLALRVSRRLSLYPTTRFSSARLRAAGFVPPMTLIEALERYSRRTPLEPQYR